MVQSEPTLEAERFRERRLELNLTQEALAEISGINQSTISQIERGAQTPSLASLMRLSQALHVSIEWLLGSDEHAPASITEPLTDTELEILKLVRQIPPRNQARVLAILREIVEIQKNR